MKKYIMVTGGSGGIGFEICKKLSKKNYYTIMIFSKSFKFLNDLKKCPNIIPLKMNLKNLKSIKSSLKKLDNKLNKNSKFEKIILCASPVPKILPILKSDSNQLLTHFKTSVVGHHFLLKNIINSYFKKNRKGQIITVLSKGILKEKKPVKYMGPYLIAKFALQKLVTILQVENPWIKIKNIYPGFTDTKMLKSFDKNYLALIKKNDKIKPAKKVATEIINKFLNE